MKRVHSIAAVTLLAVGPLGWAQVQGGVRAQGPSSPVDEVTVDAGAATTAFPHFWEQTFGSGRAILALREDYRKDLDTVHAATGFESIRFHGILDDEVGLYDPGREAKNPGLAAEKVSTNGIYNFSYVDQIYDGLLERNVRPFVELSFMPRKMAADPNMLHAFWYHPDVSPPRDYADWDAMMTALAEHLIKRYGIEEVARWNFEVWNEPNLDFWGGKPKQASYWELYDHTARALKKVSPRIRVGGPATAQAAWVGDFLKHCHDNNVPVDFASTHVYGNDDAPNVLHRQEQIPRDKMVPLAVKKVHDEIKASPYPNIPLYFSEYNASYANEPDVTDTAYMGPWLATTISQCDGLVQSMSYWSFSDVFEEQGVVRTPFYGGFGLIAEDRIDKPALHAFEMLHRLGDRRIAVQDDSVLATKLPGGGVALALWNYSAPDGIGASYTPPPAAERPVKRFTVHLKNLPKGAELMLWRVDDKHGNVLSVYDGMGRPEAPSREQIAQLRKAGEAAPAERIEMHGDSVEVEVPAHGLVVLTAGR